MNENVRVLVEKVNKEPDKWTLEDLDRLMEEDTIETATDVETIDTLLKEYPENEILEEILKPVYVHKVFLETIMFHENEIRKIEEVKDYDSSLYEVELERMRGSDDMFAYMTAWLVSISRFGIVPSEEDTVSMRDAINKFEVLLCSFHIVPILVDIIKNLLEILYFPLVQLWEQKTGQKIMSGSEETKKLFTDLKEYNEAMLIEHLNSLGNGGNINE